MTHDPLRPLPHSAEAEDAMIGGFLRDPDVFDDVRGIAAPRDCYLDRNQKVFAAAEAVLRSGRPLELTILLEELRAAGDLANVGGAARLAELFEGVATGMNAAYHARLVAGYAARRNLIVAARAIERDAQDGVASPEELQAAAERAVIDAGAGAVPDAAAEEHDLIDACLRAIDDRANGGASGLRTGLADHDRVLGPVLPGNVVVVGARPGVGKTSYALSVAANVARAGTGVYFVSMEMSKAELGDRLLALRSGVPMTAFTGDVRPTEEQAGRLLAVRGKRPAGRGGLWIDDKVTRTPEAVFSAARRAVRRYGVGLVVVDYLQLIRTPGRRGDRHDEVAEASGLMKMLAMSCGIPILLLSQLNRESEKEERRPRLSDLRESGSIEQDADKVVFLHPEDGQKGDDGEFPDVTVVEAIVEKNRNGKTGIAKVAFARPVFRYDNLARGNGYHS